MDTLLFPSSNSVVCLFVHFSCSVYYWYELESLQHRSGASGTSDIFKQYFSPYLFLLVVFMCYPFQHMLCLVAIVDCTHVRSAMASFKD